MKQLLKLISNKKHTLEYGTTSIKGVKNISRADLDMIEMYAQTGGLGMMRPRGNVLAVLEKYGYKHPEF